MADRESPAPQRRALGVFTLAMMNVAVIFLLMPNVSSSYWILSALCVFLYLIMYILLYSSAIRLRYSRPNGS